MNTSSAFGEVADAIKCGLANYKMFSQYTRANGTAYGVVPASGGLVQDPAVESADGTASVRNPYADAYILSYCFDNLKGSERLDYDGISIVGMSGSQLISEVQPLGPASGFESLTPTVVLTRTRYLQLKDGALRIIGV